MRPFIRAHNGLLNGNGKSNFRISLRTGDVFNLPIVFNPREETPHCMNFYNPLAGRLLVGSMTESWEIELVGLGRRPFWFGFK